MEELINNLMRSVETYGPNIVAALIILVVTYIIAKIVHWVLSAGINKIPFIAKANTKGKPTIGSSLGVAGFWIVILIGLVAALEKLGMTSVSTSIRSTLDQIFAYLPNLIGAAITFFVFVIVGRVAKQAVGATLDAMQADNMPQKLGIASQPVGVSKILGSVLFALIVIPGGIAALEVLNINAISEPAINMLNKVTNAIPNITVALVVIGIFGLIARFVSDLLGKILPNTGIDKAVSGLGLFAPDASITASGILSKLAGVAILLLGLIQGMITLGFAPLTEALELVLTMGAQILFGSVIIFAGVMISSVVARAMSAAGGDGSALTAKIIKNVIVILSVILGVSRMGLDPTGTFITEAAIIILIGAALAGGIAFGLGGKTWAERQLEKWK